jgi:uncharacterized OB-fold protein
MSVPRFWREIPQRYNLKASKCGVCNAIHYPPRQICPTCRRDSIGHISHTNLSGKGKVVEWTRVHKPAPGYEVHSPYLLALIQTVEGPRLMGQLVECEDFHDSNIDGLQVAGTFRRIGEDGNAGVIHYGIKWRPDQPSSKLFAVGEEE